MSDDVTPVAFERQRSALLALLEDVHVAESNCPTGARVAVVGFSAHTKHLIRFQDYRRKSQLVDAVQNIALEKTSNKRHLGASMRFVGQNVFKRVRAGTMMRKVAVFLSNGPSEDVDDIVTAVMEYRAQNIVPAVISLRPANNVRKALEVGPQPSCSTTSAPGQEEPLGRLMSRRQVLGPVTRTFWIRSSGLLFFAVHEVLLVSVGLKDQREETKHQN